MIPGLLRSLQDSGAPDLDASLKDLRQTEPKELENGNKNSLLRYMGLPLRVFEKVSVSFYIKKKEMKDQKKKKKMDVTVVIILCLFIYIFI